MDCREVLDNLSPYLDNIVSPEEKTEIEKHLAECASCREEVAGLQASITTLNLAGEVCPPEGWYEELMGKIAEPEKKKGFAALAGFYRKMARRNWVKYSTAAALLVLILGLGALSVPGVRFDFATMKSQEQKRASLPSQGENDANSGEAAIKDKYRHSMGKNVENGVNFDNSLGNTYRMNSSTSDSAQEESEAKRSEATWESATPKEESLALERKVITKAKVEIEVKKLASASSDIEKIADGAGGYIQASSVEGSGNDRQAQYTLRVPVNKFGDTLEKVKKLGEVKYASQSGEDVSKEYYDTEGRLRSLKEQENRMLALIRKGKNLHEVLAVEQELGRVRQEIESLQGQLNYLKNVTGLATLEVAVRQVNQTQVSIQSQENLGGRFLGAIVENTNRLVGFLASAVVAAGAALPWLFVLAVVILAIKFFWNRKK